MTRTDLESLAIRVSTRMDINRDTAGCHISVHGAVENTPGKVLQASGQRVYSEEKSMGLRHLSILSQGLTGEEPERGHYSEVLGLIEDF